MEKNENRLIDHSNAFQDERVLEHEWLERQVQKSLENDGQGIDLEEAPKFLNPEWEYARICVRHDLNKEERLLLIFALAVHDAPSIVQPLNFADNPYSLKIFQSGSGAPTIETFMRLVAGFDKRRRAAVEYLFQPDHIFYKQGYLNLLSVEEGNSRYARTISMDSDYVDLFIYNRYIIPAYSPEFPAFPIETKRTLSEIHFTPEQSQKVMEIKGEMMYKEYMRNSLEYKDVSPGYIALFYGEPGTGKTLTAGALGNMLKMEVLEVNLSNLVSKYIGETVKNLENLFKKARGKNWILVFNEADCLFGKRTESSGSNDAGVTHSNQVISYLLEAIPRHDGIIILTTNMRQNFDKAFGRRINGEIHFKPLGTKEAGNYLKDYVSPKLPLENYDKLDQMIERHCHYISIASIQNVVHRSTVLTLMHEEEKIRHAVMEKCLRDEVHKIKN